MKPSDVFLAMLGGIKMRRKSWPEGAHWAIVLEDEDHPVIIVGPERWVTNCHRSPSWMTRQWRATDWEPMP